MLDCIYKLLLHRCYKEAARGGWATCKVENLDKNSPGRMRVER